MTTISTPRPPPESPGELCPSLPLAPAIVLLVAVALLCEHALRRPPLPRAITQTLIHYRSADIAEAATARGAERTARPR